MDEVTVPAVAVITGGVLSATVTVDVHVLWLFAASFTVITTVLAPLFVQLKLVLLRVMIRLPDAVQLSDEPLFTSDTASVAIPEPFRLMVAFLQVATGGTLSETVTVKLHRMLVFPLVSVVG